MTNPPIGQALAFDHGERLVSAFSVGDLERGAEVAPEIGRSKVAVKVRFAAQC